MQVSGCERHGLHSSSILASNSTKSVFSGGCVLQHAVRQDLVVWVALEPTPCLLQHQVSCANLVLSLAGALNFLVPALATLQS